jgi:outer membrane protein assembly complex protein YaeT
MKATERVLWAVSSPPWRFAGVLAGVLVGAAACIAQALPVPPSQPAPAKELVADVIPQGNHNVPTQKIMSLLKTRPGGEYSQEVVNEDVRKLYQTGSFANIQVKLDRTPQGLVVYFQFQEPPGLVQEVEYKGAKHLKPEELDNLTGLRKGGPLNPTLIRTAKETILRRYGDDGRPLASVDIVSGLNPGDTRIVFNITEGPVVRISHIDITGNTFVSEARLKTQINSSRTILSFGGQYRGMMVDEDVNKLTEYYRSFGFHDVRVARELQYEGADRVRVIFHVQEGQRYRVAGVDVSVNGAGGNRDEMLTLVTLHPDEIYSKSESDVTEAKLKAYGGFRGYDTTVHERLVWEKTGQVTVHYDVEERPPATVGQIIIVGNEVTKQNVILRQVPLYPGQVLTYPDLRVAERNLARLNIFEANAENGVRPTVNVLDPDSDNPVKDILVNVQETQTGSLMFGVGVNSDAGLTGSIVLNERNFDILRPPTSFDDFLGGTAFRGAGQEFRIEAVPGTQIQRYTVSWREPFLFDTPYSLGVSGYYYDRVFNEYTESRLGGRVTIGRQFNRLWSGSVTFRAEDVGVHSVPFFAPQDFQTVQGNNSLFSVRLGVTRDSRDSYLRPTEGSLVDVSVEEETGSFTFPVFNVEANKYFTIWQRPDSSGRHVLALRSQMSIEGSNAPVYERFYAGGFRTMRGFEFRGVGPDINGFKVGGDFMWLNSAEYQIPIRANDQFYLVGFIDSGTVEPRTEIKEYRLSTGVGARIVVPMLGPVPIALDFGFPLVKAPEDNKQLFSFWVGFFH